MITFLVVFTLLLFDNLISCCVYAYTQQDIRFSLCLCISYMLSSYRGLEKIVSNDKIAVCIMCLLFLYIPLSVVQLSTFHSSSCDNEMSKPHILFKVPSL